MSQQELVVGIDLGGTHFQVGVVDPNGEILGRARGKTLADEGIDAVLGRLAAGVDEAIAASGEPRKRVAGVGLAAPGALDHTTGVIVNAPNMGWYNEPVADRFSERCGLRVVLENDVNAALWGENTLGAGRNARHALGVWLGTGVGGGLILDGSLYRGEMLTAGELGHVVVRPELEPPAWELEQLSSRTAVVRRLCADIESGENAALARACSGDTRELSLADVRAAFDAGDEPTIRAIEDGARWIGSAVGSVVTLLSLKVILVGGGLAEAMGPGFLKLIKREIDRHAWPSNCQDTDVRLTELADNAGLLGAAMLARSSLTKAD